MITREEMKKETGLNLRPRQMDLLEKLLEAEQAKYQALVDASVKLEQWMYETYDWQCDIDVVRQFRSTLKETLSPPPPLLSEKLDKLASSPQSWPMPRNELRQLADEAREIEK